MQHTVTKAITFDGVGLHSGRAVTMTVHPAPEDYGICFQRTDVDGPDAVIPARWDLVEQSPLCTRLRNASGVELSTVEHIMAALIGCGVHNALIEVSGAEVPILDGSSVPFVRAILHAGLTVQTAPVRAIEVLCEVEVAKGEAWARVAPSDTLRMDFQIDFADAAIGRQTKSLMLANGAFVRELCDSRTFCRQSDVDTMRANGLALGGTLENAVVVDGDAVLSPGGLRHRDEAVRHKMLDAMGDLALAGAPILGHYEGHRAGHALTNALLRALFADPSNYRWVTCDQAQSARLPGVGVTRHEVPSAAAAPAL
ncbi:UDP-3-O-acyl-N-acetylglucosamine deacetylase [Pseudaestuariivita sp.]|uniref:UDP-3-O-acyl-N-acetylglucosamine deacetylase n=1 Tax=Pseudaestuariivita sp. TaxID=2211669 RepID=UPI0040585CD3